MPEEFEESFQACLNLLIDLEASSSVEKEKIEQEIKGFIDHAKQLEVFFLQKRLLLSALKPELLVNEVNNELKCELQRKDELLRNHYDRIEQWRSNLSQMQDHIQEQNQTGTQGIQQAKSQSPASERQSRLQKAVASAQPRVFQHQTRHQHITRPQHPPAYPGPTGHTAIQHR